MNNEPVITSGIITIITAVLTPVLLQLGFSTDTINSTVSVILAIITGLVSLYSIWHARKKVTPIANPNIPGMAVVPDTGNVEPEQ